MTCIEKQQGHDLSKKGRLELLEEKIKCDSRTEFDNKHFCLGYYYHCPFAGKFENITGKGVYPLCEYSKLFDRVSHKTE